MSDFLQQATGAQERGELLASTLENLKLWLEQPEYEQYRPQIEQLIQSGEWTELDDCFYIQIPFGTGGRRGTEGVGPNRINERTIGESAAGLADYLLSKGEQVREQGVVVACDTRRNSRLYSELTAEVLAAHKIRTYLFDSFRPTPELSFAVRELRAAAGVVITASHNPPSDNGFKAYGADGGQVVPPDDNGIIQCVSAVRQIERMPLQQAITAGLVRIVGSQIDQAYLDRVCGLNLCDERDLDFVYTPLHGAGAVAVVPALERLGFGGLHLVERQAVPDPMFSSVPGGKPNPEETASMGLAVEQADRIGAALVMASDPDADRLGVAVKHHGQWVFLKGNQVGALLCWFVLDRLSEQGALRPDGVVIETLVSTDLVKRIAQGYGLEVIDHLLVGFKWIGRTIGSLDDSSRFIFGFEESLGYLMGDFVRDKDAVIAALLLAQCAAHLQARGRGLVDQLDELMRQHGVFVELQRSIFLEGAQGSLKMRRIMDALRNDPPTQLGAMPVHAVTDRQTLLRKFSGGRVESHPDWDSGDVLTFHLSEDLSDRITVRPSGTEPKIKHYAQFSLPFDKAAGIEQLRSNATERAEQAMQALLDLEAAISGTE
ncbi:MAG: phospho-sugar mutase [Candidatus Alcyoniella australis]|nr:phospho-sugar mutase [Candidatus Alcyoniella australis]